MSYRLSFHHAHNTEKVMNSVTRWVYLMTKKMQEYYHLKT